MVLRSGKGIGEERHARGCRYSAAGPRAAHQDENLQESCRTQRRPRRARDAPLQGPRRDWYVLTTRTRLRPGGVDPQGQCRQMGSSEWKLHRKTGKPRVSGPASKRGRFSFSSSKPLPRHLGALGLGSGAYETYSGQTRLFVYHSQHLCLLLWQIQQ